MYNLLFGDQGEVEFYLIHKCGEQNRDATGPAHNSLFLCKSGRFTNRESLKGGGWGAPEVNNLVCTKRQKHINANSTHETTVDKAVLRRQCSTVLSIHSSVINTFKCHQHSPVLSKQSGFIGVPSYAHT